MAAGGSPALICDTGALLDYLIEDSPGHRAFGDAIDGARARYVPGLVLAEVDYFLRAQRSTMTALIRDLTSGAFTYAPPDLDLIRRAMDIDLRHSEVGLGLVDASIVALADQLGIRRIATRDVRHFTAARLSDGSPFELVVHPADLDRS